MPWFAALAGGAAEGAAAGGAAAGAGAAGAGAAGAAGAGAAGAAEAAAAAEAAGAAGAGGATAAGTAGGLGASMAPEAAGAAGTGAASSPALAGANALASGSPEYASGLGTGGTGGFSGATETGAGYSGMSQPGMGTAITPQGTTVSTVNPAASPGSSWGDMAGQAWSKLKSGANQLMQLRDPHWEQETPTAKIGSIIQGLDPQSHPAKSTPWMQFGLPGGAGIQFNPPNRPQLDPQAQQLAIMQAFNMQ